MTRQATSEPKFLQSSPPSVSEVQLRKNPGVTSVSKTVWRGRPPAPTPRKFGAQFQFCVLRFRRLPQNVEADGGNFVCVLAQVGLVGVAVEKAGRNRVVALEVEEQRQDFDDAARRRFALAGKTGTALVSPGAAALGRGRNADANEPSKTAIIKSRRMGKR